MHEQIKINPNNTEIESGLLAPAPWNGRTVNLFWSGGLDSTYLLLWLIGHGFKVNAIWVEIENNARKNEREKQARQKIFDKIRKEYPKVFWNLNYSIDPVFKISGLRDYRTNLCQPPIWLLATQFHCQGNEFAIWYVCGDDACMWIDDIKNVIGAYNGLAKKDENVVIHFPLLSVKKCVFYRDIPKDILDIITWCEMGDGENENCRCGACVTHRHLLDKLEIKPLVYRDKELDNEL